MDISTQLSTALDRAVDGIIDGIASDGLVALKRVLDGAGFTKSEHLKNYEIMAHVSGNEITFEILLDIEAMDTEDEATRQALEEKMEAVQRDSSKTYKMSRKGRVQRLESAKKPARDARRPARDARKGSGQRLIEHEIALRAPRSARVSRTGKLAVALKRSVRDTGKGIELPKDQFQGIVGEFVGEIKTVISNQFVPLLSSIVKQYVVG